MLERLGRISPVGQRALLILVCGVFFFTWLFRTPITQLDESLYTEVSREMVESHDCLIPHFDYVRFFEKPIMAYWTQAASIRVFGVHEWSLRLPSALWSLLLVLVVHSFLSGWLVRRAPAGDTQAQVRARGAAFLGGLATATMPMVTLWARAATMDAATTFFTTAAILAILQADLVRRASPDPAIERFRIRRGYLMAAFFAGLAFLTKGPVGVLVPGWIWLVYHVVQRDIRAESSRVPWGYAVLLLALVAAPWYVATYLVDGSAFLRTFFLSENVARFASVTREEHGFGAPLLGRVLGLFTYVPIALVLLFPYSAFLLRELLLPFGGGAVERQDRLLPHMRRFAWVWVLGDIGLFSLSRTQLPSYIQAVAAGAGMLFALHVLGRLPRTENRGEGRLSARIGSRGSWARAIELGALSLIGLVFAALPIYALPYLGKQHADFGAAPLPQPTTWIAMGLTAGLGIVFQVRIWRPAWRRNAPGLIGWTMCVWGAMLYGFLICGMLYVNIAYSRVVQVGEFLASQPSQERVIVYHSAHPESLVFNARRPIEFYDEHGQRRRYGYLPEGPTPRTLSEEITSARSAGETVLVVTDEAGLDKVSTIEPTVVLRRFERVLVARVAPERM